MIRSFRHRALERFFVREERRGLDARRQERIRLILDRLDAAGRPEDMALPGLDFHALKGNLRGRFSVSVSGNWRITFAFAEGDAIEVDLEDYH